jgi:hypothetical protein
MGCPVGLKRSPRLPWRSQALVVRHCVLDNESLNPLRMRQGYAKTHGAAVILHVECIVRKPERFGETRHDLGAVIKGVGKLFRVRPVAVPKSRVIRRDEMIVVGESSEQRFEHPR